MGDREAQTPSSSMTMKICGIVSPSSAPALAVDREVVVWTGVSDAQTWPSTSAKKTTGIATIFSAALDRPLIGQMASALTVTASTREKMRRFLFIDPTSKMKVSSHYITKAVCEICGSAA